MISYCWLCLCFQWFYLLICVKRLQAKRWTHISVEWLVFICDGLIDRNQEEWLIIDLQATSYKVKLLIPREYISRGFLHKNFLHTVSKWAFITFIIMHKSSVFNINPFCINWFKTVTDSRSVFWVGSVLNNEAISPQTVCVDSGLECQGMAFVHNQEWRFDNYDSVLWRPYWNVDKWLIHASCPCTQEWESSYISAL